MKPITRISAVTLLAIALVVLALWLLPGESLWRQLLRLIVAGGIVYFIYLKICPVNYGGKYTLLTFWTILSIGLTLNVWYFTTHSGGTVYDPVLLNDDASTAWTQMLATMQGSDSGVYPTRRGYGELLALLSIGGRARIDTLLIFNMMATLIAIVLTGAATARMCSQTGGKGSARVCTAALIMCGAVAYFLMTGTILIKDAMCCMTMALTLFALFGRSRIWLRVGLLLIAGAISYAIRPNFLIFIILAIVIEEAFAKRRHIAAFAAVSVLFVALYLWKSAFGTVALPFEASDMSTNFIVSTDETAERVKAYSTVGGDYEWNSNLKKLILLPFSLAVQFFTPLPWAFDRHIIFGPTQALSHFAMPWYALGGIILYYPFKAWKNSPRGVKASFIFAVVAWCATAFMTGGTVSRYCLPWLPFLVPSAAWVIASGAWKEKTFKRWALIYCALIVIALIVIYTVINHYSPDGWVAS